jgi:hypothetical protein
VTRLFQTAEAATDIRPAMFSMAALMILLLPLLLLVGSPQKNTGLPLSVAGPAEELPPAPPGPVESLEVRALEEGFQIKAEVRTTDVRATAGDTESKGWETEDLEALQKVLRQVKGLDASRKRITVRPGLSYTAQQVVQLMDVVQRDQKGELFTEIVLQGKRN